MRAGFKKCLLACIALGVLLIVLHDAKFHFDKSTVTLKRKHQSPQRDWSLFYGQNYVFYDSSMRYERDFRLMSQLVAPGSIVLSDLATSYYSAAYLPVYVRNVQRHHGKTITAGWRRLLKNRTHCYLNQQKNVTALEKFVRKENKLSEQVDGPKLKYVIVNNDEYNRNPRFDCFWNGREAAIENLEKISTKLYTGEHLILYELNR